MRAADDGLTEGARPNRDRFWQTRCPGRPYEGGQPANRRLRPPNVPNTVPIRKIGVGSLVWALAEVDPATLRRSGGAKPTLK